MILIFQGLIALYPDAHRIALSMVYVWVEIARVFMDGGVMRAIQ